MKFLKLVVAFLIVFVFMCWPFLINWISICNFKGQPYVFFGSIFIYEIYFTIMTGMVYNCICDSCSTDSGSTDSGVRVIAMDYD